MPATSDMIYIYRCGLHLLRRRARYVRRRRARVVTARVVTARVVTARVVTARVGDVVRVGARVGVGDDFASWKHERARSSRHEGTRLDLRVRGSS